MKKMNEMRRMMTKSLMVCLLSLSTAITFVACGSDDDVAGTTSGDGISMGQALVRLTGFDGSLESIPVQLRSMQSGMTFTEKSNAQGTVTFNVTPGVYEASASATITQGNTCVTLNGVASQIVVKSGATTEVELKLASALTSQLIIKEVYNGGVLKEDGKLFQADKCIILYNNSSQPVASANLCIGMLSPYNSQASNKWYEGGKLVYESEGYVPALDGIWYFPDTLRIDPYQQVVVNCCGAIDNTQTYPQSVNYANKDYYCMYDPEAGYTNTTFYPTPADVIPTSHYLKAVRIGTSNAWALSTTSPAIILFQTADVDPFAYGTNEANMTYVPGAAQTNVNKVLKVPAEWVLDGIEVFSANHTTENMKRLTADIDAGYVKLTNQHGHVLYRNVDKEATEAISSNAGKLVYQYALGVDGSTDPNSIDAEASMKQGARIVFMDTNNSSADFHERAHCSLKDN